MDKYTLNYIYIYIEREREREREREELGAWLAGSSQVPNPPSGLIMQLAEPLQSKQLFWSKTKSKKCTEL